MDPAAPPRASSTRAISASALVTLVASLALVALLSARALGLASPPPALDVAFALVLAWKLLRRTGLERPATGIVVAAIALYSLYLGYTSADDRNYDVHAHLMYVRYVAEHLALPAKNACNICHHPPAYYVLAAALYRVLVLVHASEPALGLQILALVLVSIFVACAALILQRTLPTRTTRLAATALVAFWPYTVIDTGRVGNDALLYAVAGGVMLALVSWRRTGGDRPLWIAALLVVVGLFTKTNALVLAALFCAACAEAIVRAPRRGARLRALLPPMALVVAGALVKLAVRHTERRPGLLYGLLGNAEDVGSWALTPRTAHTYLWFDPKEFLSTPYQQVTIYGSNSEPFWNQLLKSSLLGTRRSLFGIVGTTEPVHIARALNVLLLVLAAFLIAGQLAALRPWPRARTIAIATSATFIAAVVAFHWLVPFGYHADFRFIHPVLVPMAWLYVDGAMRLGRRARALGAASLGVAAIFLATSVAYFLPATWQKPPVRRPTDIGDLTHIPPLAPVPSVAPSVAIPRFRLR